MDLQSNCRKYSKQIKQGKEMVIHNSKIMFCAWDEIGEGMDIILAKNVYRKQG